MKRLVSTFFATLVLSRHRAFGAQAADVPGVTDTEIKVGSFGPLTGPVYIYGKLTMNGVEVYFNEAQQEGRRQRTQAGAGPRGRLVQA